MAIDKKKTNVNPAEHSQGSQTGNKTSQNVKKAQEAVNKNKSKEK